MTEMPTHVTPTQLKAAAEALGLDASDVTHFQADATNGVIVIVLARDTGGKRLAAGNCRVELAHHIPISDDPDGDQL